jgi:hypothetical protein
VRSLATRILIAAACFVASTILWADARILERSARSHERLATLQYLAADDAEGRDMLLSSWLPSPGAPFTSEIASRAAIANYWTAAYDRLDSNDVATRRTSPEPGQGEVDPQLLLLTANAAFRQSQRALSSRDKQLQQLESVLQAYASVLKSGRFLADAAYNYEFVARLRDSIAQKTPRREPRGLTAPAGDLPAGVTIHGEPGGPPPGTRGEEFQIIAPMEYGDRETQPEPNPGGRPIRKG